MNLSKATNRAPGSESTEDKHQNTTERHGAILSQKHRIIDIGSAIDNDVGAAEVSGGMNKVSWTVGSKTQITNRIMTVTIIT
jgi:hypothetical protein